MTKNKGSNNSTNIDLLKLRKTIYLRKLNIYNLESNLTTKGNIIRELQFIIVYLVFNLM